VGKDYAASGWTPGTALWEYRPVPSPVERARALWDALESDGFETLRPLVDADVEWRPWGDHGRRLVGLEQIVEWHRADRGTYRVVHRWEGRGDCALASGSLRVLRQGGFLDVQPTWAFFFRGERLSRAVCYANREEAVAAVEAFVPAA
jgi:hypothetical protein